MIKFSITAMFTLLFDTSSERSFVALFENEQIIHFEELPLGLQNSKFLVPAIDAILKKNNIEPKALGQIVCGIGPGSYTGLRVAASVAKCLAYALNIPLMGASVLQALSQVHNCAVLDAKIGGFYTSFNGQKPKIISTAQDLPPICYTPYSQSLKVKYPKIEFRECAPDPFLMLKMATAPFELLYLQEWMPQG